MHNIQKQALLELDFKDPNNQVSDDELVIGFVTKQTVRKLLDEGASTQCLLSSCSGISCVCNRIPAKMEFFAR